MHTCDHGDAVVVYGRFYDCPLCEAESLIKDLERQASQLANESASYEREAGEALKELRQLQAEMEATR